MENSAGWGLSEEEKEKMIDALLPELVLLRTKAEVSQEELSAFIGISRQTYGAIERGSRRPSWNTLLSLVLFFDCNRKTRQMLQSVDGIRGKLLRWFNAGSAGEEIDLEAFVGDRAGEILKRLDEQAIRSIRTVLMVEYARCTSTPGETVVRSFDGVSLAASCDGAEAEWAMRAIRRRAQADEHS